MIILRFWRWHNRDATPTMTTVLIDCQIFSYFPIICTIISRMPLNAPAARRSCG